VHKRNKPVTFFIPLLVLGILPWLGFLLQSLVAGLRNEGRGFQPKKMLLVWTIFIFVFFSASHSKLTGYILPIFPSLALLIAIQLEKASTITMKWAAGLLFVLGLAGLVGGFVAPAFLAVKDEPPVEIALNLGIMHWVIAACALLIIGAIAAWIYAGRQKDWSLMSMAMATYLAGQALMLGYEPWGYYRAGLNHLAAIQAELKPDTPIYSVGQYEQCLPFYLGRTMTLVEFPDELEFGLKQEPQLWLEKRADFIQQWRSKAAQQQAAIALVNPRIYDDFVKIGLPMRVVAQSNKRVILSTLPVEKQ
jgi:4-amino-4-deoxy-L-arabinose transferase-like glycosyltransferase